MALNTTVDKNVPNDVSRADETETVAPAEQVDLDLGVDPENDSPEHREWLKAVKDSPMVRDDGMTKSPTAPDDGIFKEAVDKPAADVKKMVIRDRKAAAEANVPRGFEGEHITGEKD